MGIDGASPYARAVTSAIPSSSVGGLAFVVLDGQRELRKFDAARGGNGPHAATHEVNEQGERGAARGHVGAGPAAATA